MRCGDENGCFLSFAPRPSSLTQTAGKDASASHVVKEVLNLQCWSMVGKAVQEWRQSRCWGKGDRIDLVRLENFRPLPVRLVTKMEWVDLISHDTM